MLGVSSVVRSGRQWGIVSSFLFVSSFFFCTLFKARRDVSTCDVSTRLDPSVDMSASCLSECIKRTEDKPSRIPLLPESELGFEPLLLSLNRGRLFEVD